MNIPYYSRQCEYLYGDPPVDRQSTMGWTSAVDTWGGRSGFAQNEWCSLFDGAGTRIVMQVRPFSLDQPTHGVRLLFLSIRASVAHRHLSTTSDSPVGVCECFAICFYALPLYLKTLSTLPPLPMSTPSYVFGPLALILLSPLALQVRFEQIYIVARYNA